MDVIAGNNDVWTLKFGWLWGHHSAGPVRLCRMAACGGIFLRDLAPCTGGEAVVGANSLQICSTSMQPG